MDLKGKKLLLMGGSAFGQGLRKYADETGFRMIAVGKDLSRLETFADEVYPIDTQDVDALEKLIREKEIDGIFVGATEVNIPPAIELNKRTGVRFYVSEEQWAILANKRRFKSLLRSNGIPTIPDYDLSAGLTEKLISEIKFPVLVKPADSSGARGITVAHNLEELRRGYEYAESYSASDQVLVEQLMQGVDDLYIRYHLQDGVYSLSGSLDRYVNTSQGGFGGVAIAYIHPSRHLTAFIEQYDAKFRELFKSLGLKDGIISLQCFADKNENFYFYEAGYRMCGSQSYVFYDALNHSSTLQYMVNYALTGKMADFKIAERDNPFITVPCVNLYIALKAGTVCTFEGIDEARKIPGVLNATVMFGKGTTVEKTGSLNQVSIRFHVTGKSRDELDQIFQKIYDTIRIEDENGQDMILEHFSFSCLEPEKTEE